MTFSVPVDYPILLHLLQSSLDAKFTVNERNNCPSPSRSKGTTGPNHKERRLNIDHVIPNKIPLTTCYVRFFFIVNTKLDITAPPTGGSGAQRLHFKALLL